MSKKLPLFFSMLLVVMFSFSVIISCSSGEQDVQEDQQQEEQVEEISQHKLSFDELDNDNEFESVSDEIEEDIEEYDEDLEFDL